MLLVCKHDGQRCKNQWQDPWEHPEYLNQGLAYWNTNEGMSFVLMDISLEKQQVSFVDFVGQHMLECLNLT